MQKQTKKIFKYLAFFSGLFVLFLIKVFFGEGGDALQLSKKAQNILASDPSFGIIPIVRADTPPPPDPSICYNEGGGYTGVLQDGICVFVGGGVSGGSSDQAGGGGCSGSGDSGY